MRNVPAALLLLPLVACTASAPAPNLEAEAATLMETSRAWSAAAGSGDTEAILSYWADDAVMMAPGQPPLRGKPAIREYVEGMSSIPGARIEWEPLEAHVASSADMAYLIERNRVSFHDSTGATVTETNKVVTVWRKQPDGSWENVIDMWNADPSPY
jgi:uncharacterized protein (TIGR02246 family)